MVDFTKHQWIRMPVNLWDTQPIKIGTAKTSLTSYELTIDLTIPTEPQYIFGLEIHGGGYYWMASIGREFMLMDKEEMDEYIVKQLSDDFNDVNINIPDHIKNKIMVEMV